jgi:nitrate/TMAO reductase-like tetraheme cytochrome c subunit
MNLSKLAWLFKTPKRIALTCVCALFAFIAFLFGSIELTSTPRFCGTCHYMQPYYQQWKTSTHNKVACIKCHIKPGLKNKLAQKMEALHEVVSMATGKYPPRPHAEVSDETCLRQGCHETRLLEGKVLLKNGVQFNHTPHLTQERRGKHLQCTSCHAQMVMGKHMAVTEEVCFLCHFKNKVDGIHPVASAFCQLCHTSIPENITIRNTTATFNHKDYIKPGVQCQDCHIEVVRGRGEVPEIMCSRCHADPERLKRINDTEFMHENHVTKHKVECYWCHLEIKHQAYPQGNFDAGVNCAQCHGGSHSPSAQLYKGEGGSVKGEPSAMFTAQVDCIACHRPDTTGKIQGHGILPPKPDASRCAACHGDDGAGYLKDWKKQLADDVAKTTRLLNQAAGVAKIQKTAEAKKLFDEAKQDLEFVVAADGVHNLDYAQTLLKGCREKLERSMALAR